MVPRDCRITTPKGWSRHYAFASIRHGSILQRDCSPGFLAWFNPSLSHASEWVAGQNLADPNTWNSSVLQTLKQLHDNLLTHYNCTEWAPPLADDASAPGVGRMRTMAKLLLVHRYLHNVRSQSTSCKRGRCMSRCCEICLRTACVMYKCFITPNQCPRLIRPLPCMAINGSSLRCGILPGQYSVRCGILPWQYAIHG